MNELINLEEILQPGGKIYFVGIGGIAMSAVAGMAAKLGFEVAGSDSKELYSPSKEILAEHKINCFLGYKAEQVAEAKANVYVLSAGENENNPEVDYIIKNNLPRVSFAELLYFFSKDSLRVVVAGTHGKSTTTGLLGHLFKNLDNSSFLAGGVLQNYQSNFYLGDGHYFVFEGDEYKAQFDDPSPKFHYYKPDILVLTNLEYDHPDLFPNFESLQSEFRLLIEKMPEDGLIVYNADDAELSKLVHESNISTVSFGIDNEADVKTEQIQFGSDFTTIEVLNKFSKNVATHLMGQTEQYKIQLPGKINVYNALAGIALLRSLGFAQEQIALELLSYLGIKRRFEVVSKKGGITIIDDYAHHPTAVSETLKAAKLKYPDSKIWAVFEPHTFSRTKATINELAASFDQANEVLLSEIYPAREKASTGGITSGDVINAIKEHNTKHKIHNTIRHVADKEQALNILREELKSGDVVIIMAVGAFNRLAYELKEII
ncbi:MAG: UDP-N-acetylmuramate--L-alanine ligase [Candidatus Doudnabacteria bacterium]|nr:UDP-N-acetylmuramate--L-alanine ligase [Candidatus Doudnabacteria bacterium]